MPCRRIGLFLACFCLAAHLFAMARISLPSQDGLKFIAVAQEFSRQPAWDVIRSADQHPLYPALLALAHPLFRPFQLESHVSWRLAAQAVSLVAALATLWPLYQITRRLYRPVTAFLALFLWLILPMPMSLGHETLSDATALAFIAWSLYLGLLAAESRRVARRTLYTLASAICVGAGYWTRPEAVLAAPAIIAAIVWKNERRLIIRMAELSLFAGVVGGLMIIYLNINSTLSDRLAAFQAADRSSNVAYSGFSHLPKGLPEALRDPRLDFSPKDPAREVGRAGLSDGLQNLLRLWAESLGDALAVMTLWGLFRCRTHNPRARLLIRIQAVLLILALGYQASFRGYLASRHVVGLTFLSVPHAAAALRLSALRFAGLVKLIARQRRAGTRLALAAMAFGGVWLQAKPIHGSRQGHQKAGEWLRTNAGESACVFDTRGWAAFQADRRRYDPYHIAQALSDKSTEFWVVEAGELTSGSRRAATLSGILADGGRLAARFPRKADREDAADVLVFAWSRPALWDRPDAAGIAAWRAETRLDPAVVPASGVKSTISAKAAKAATANEKGAKP